MPKSNPRPYYLKTEFLERYAFGPYDEDHRLKAMALALLDERTLVERFDDNEIARQSTLATAKLEQAANAEGGMTNISIMAEEILRLRGVIDGLIEGAREVINTADLIAHRPDDTGGDE